MQAVSLLLAFLCRLSWHGYKNSYFWNLAPYYDFTFSSTLYTQQGLLTEAEWRQRFKTGNYNIRFAHIYQMKPRNFNNDTIDAQHKNRYMFATKGDFRINSHWAYGWDIFSQSDRHFSRAYKLENYNNPTQLSQLYLNGLAGKNYFDMRFYHFKVQDLILDDPHERHSRQAWVLPRIDYFLPQPNQFIMESLLFIAICNQFIVVILILVLLTGMGILSTLLGFLVLQEIVFV